LPVATNGYCTVSEFKTWAGITDEIDDTTIDRASTAVSRGIDNFTKREFWRTFPGTNRVFDSRDGYGLDIDDAVAVTQVATDTDNDGVYETVWTAADYQLLPLNPAAAPEPEPFTEIRAAGSLRFPRPVTRVGLVQVTGTWGWPAIPMPVYQAALILVHRTIKRRGSPEGVAGFDEFGQIRISTRDDPDAVRYLLPYQKVEFGVA
jgi:hypothetical protein